MSNKSLFEKLFEEVMSDDAEALGISPEAPEAGGEMEDSMGGADDKVTLSMDRETAQKLHDLLAGVLGGEETADEGLGEEGEGEEGEGEEGEGEEDGESYGQEDSEDEDSSGGE